MDEVTLLLILKDRAQYTRKLMNSLQDSSCPFKILIADGGKDTEIQDILSTPQSYPGLNYEYIRYPYDESLDHFYEKMGDAVSRIATPLTSVIDNDDLLHIDGVKKCVEVLEDRRYSSARGRVDNTSGQNIYRKFPDPITGKTAFSRMVDQTKHFHGNWHNVTRSNHVKACWLMLNVIRPQNFRFTEQLTGYLNVIWGDGYRGDFPWLIHYSGERIKTEDGSLQEHFPDQSTWINSDYWLYEFNKMTEVVGVAIAYHDGISVSDAMDKFSESYPYKLPNLKQSLKKRILEAKKLGYNEQRIATLYRIVEKCDVTKLIG